MPEPSDRAARPDPRRRAGLRMLCAAGMGGALTVLTGGRSWADDVVLVVKGQVDKPNAGPEAQFDMAALERLPQVSFTARTPWYANPRRFTGPLLRDVLGAAGAHGTTLRVRALNDYRIDMPFEDALRHDPILARLLDGQPMSVRDKGPLFLIYPFDDRPELRSAIYFSRSVWQVKSIEVV